MLNRLFKSPKSADFPKGGKFKMRNALKFDKIRECQHEYALRV